MATLRVIFHIAANDFRLTLKARGIIAWIFAMPLVFMLVFGLAMKGSSGTDRKARLTVDNRDAGFISRSLIEELRAEPLDVVDSLKAGESAIRTLVIPEGFTEDVLARRKVALELQKESGADVEASAAVNAAVFRCLLRVVSPLIEMEAGMLERGTKGFAFKGDSLAGSPFEASLADPRLLGQIEAGLDSLRAEPSLVTLRSTAAGALRKVPSGFQSSVPGSLVMFVLMTMVFSGAAITVERSTGVLRRYAYSPAGKGSIIVGKLLGRMLIAFVQIVFLLLVGKYLFRISLGSSTGALVVLMFVFAFCTGAFGILFGSLFRNPEQVSAISIIATLAMSALGGCWWPIELVPRAFKTIAFVFPTGWAMDGIHKIISFGYGMGAIAPDAAVLAGFGAAFVLLASWRLRPTD
ncbi:MAG: ABC transporter permease [Candidatus Krumholzibacteria bacterium]|nr:ABC transporter permease [Candidatus Krumholzibacteria bacterium]